MRVTISGIVAGSPAYQPGELATRSPATPRSSTAV